MSDMLERNLAAVRARIAAACGRAGRDPSGVQLVAVTKTATAEVAAALAGLGVTDLGENRIQEAAKKRAALPGLGVRWHMIGHLQTNKVNEAVRLFDLIHSVDSVRLAGALAGRTAREMAAGERRDAMPVLVQVNVSGEESKGGLRADEAGAAVREMAKLEGIRVRGLMTMAPLVDDPEAVRPVFRRLRELRDEIGALGIEGVEMAELSMGMTQDFEVAVEEGATVVRVGTALFREE